MSVLARPTAQQMTIAGLCLAIVLGGAFVGAAMTQHNPIFSLSPPKSTAPDLTEAQRLDLHRTFFTAWATMLLLIPALCSLPSRRASGYWLAFWTVSFIAFAVHLYWAIFVIFQGDWSRIMNTTRVSAPILDSVLAVWWALDVLIAWATPRENRFIAIERWVVSVLAFVLFVAGSAKEGEIPLSRALGFVFGGAVLICWIASLARRRKASA